MAKSNSHHVVPDPDGGWNVRRNGANRVSGHFQTKIQARDSHGNDPFPPKG